MTKLNQINLLVRSGVAQAAVVAALVTAAAGGQGGSLTTICHIPPGNPANPQTITVSSAALDAHLGHGDTVGTCASACSANGAACAASTECCSGNCASGTCADACGANGSDCSSSSECCSGICSGEGLCTAECTIGPEFMGDFCNADLPCCPGSGVCIGGACFTEEEVACDPHVGASCDNEDPMALCCFDYLCIDNTCVPF